MVDTGIEAFQVWFGLQAPAIPGGHTESPASATAGNDGKFGSGAVYPPVEEEYSVVSGTPSFPNSMTYPVVSTVAASVSGLSLASPR